MANFRLSDFFPQKFTGENNASPLAHWLQYQDYCGANELVQAEWVTRFRITLSGQARLWIEGKQFADVNDLKRRFIEHHSGVHSREASVTAFRAISYRQGESMETYLGRLKPFSERLGYQEELLRDQFLSGLPHDVKVAVSMSAANTTAGMVEAAQRFVDLQNSQPRVREVSFAVGKGEKTLHSQLESMRKDIDKLRFDSEGGRPSRDKFSKSPQMNRRGTRSAVRGRTDFRHVRAGRCNYCNDEGHFWRDCFKLQKDMEQRRGRQVRQQPRSRERGLSPAKSP